jgi:hypothetical protein
MKPTNEVQRDYRLGEPDDTATDLDCNTELKYITG